ncbi:MAG: hypothetical protein IT327_17560 [Anaerolineae bacterium]|nr:hypothetical protein [Anaerolineae bacterium]
MTKLIGLFADEMKAEEAINALTTAGMDDIEFETISRAAEASDTAVAAAPTLGADRGAAVVPVAGNLFSSWSLDTEEAEYFRRNVQNGGVLVVVDVDDDDNLPRVRTILEESGEKVAVSS